VSEELNKPISHEMGILLNVSYHPQILLQAQLSIHIMMATLLLQSMVHC